MSDVAAPPLRNEARRSRRPWIVVVVAVVLVVTGVAVWFAHWRSSLRSLVDYPTYGTRMPTTAGHSLYFGEQLISRHAIDHGNNPGELSIDISSIRPVVEQNTADAEIAVLRCVLSGKGGGPTGDGRAITEGICSKLTPFSSGQITLGFTMGDDDIVIEVTPRHAGVVRLAGIDVRYSSGLRHGSVHAGSWASVVVRG